MTLQNALTFIRAVRQDEALRRRVSEVELDNTLQSLLDIAADAGFEFTENELRSAHSHDWAMRWMTQNGTPRRG